MDYRRLEQSVFSPLGEDEEDAREVLCYIQQWLGEVIDPDTRVYFLVDAIYGERRDSTIKGARCTLDELTNRYCYPKNHIALLSIASDRQLSHWEHRFEKTEENRNIQDYGVLSPKLLSFLGLKWHEDETINDAIQFYAMAWETRWQPKGWEHNALQDNCSDHLRALADWLVGVSIDTLYYSPDEGQSAKSLMMWEGATLWESRRSIQGKVLNAALEKLRIPLSKTSPIPDSKFINPPKCPCFPFLVSLRSFLWHCEKENNPVPVSEIGFFQHGEGAQVNTLRINLKLNNSERLERKFLGRERRGTFTNSLEDLTHCRTAKLMDGKGRDYMRLFTEGTEHPVVEVKITPNHIDLSW